jgi:predicted nuclease of predicted toxin-antitoxin system
MKILLDESLPRKLRIDIEAEHEVWTVKNKGWLNKKNGELLKLMTDDNFDIFVTVDRNLPYQQNIERFPVTIIVLCAKDNRQKTLQMLIPKMLARISEGNFQKVMEIS